MDNIKSDILKQKAEVLKEKKHMEGKFSIFDTKFAKNIEKNGYSNYVFDVFEDWNERCNIPLEAGLELYKLSENPDQLLAIHRTHICDFHNENGSVKSNDVVDIANNGLINNGHLSSGAYTEVPEPSYTLSPLSDLSGFINLVASYKQNNAVIIYSLPSNCVNEDLEFINSESFKKIYNFDNGIVRIKPELIVGMILKNPNATDIFLTRDDMLNLGDTKTR